MFLGTIGNCLTVAIGTCTGTGMLKTFGSIVYQVKGGALIILTSVLGLAVAYFLFKFAWRHIKGTVK